jgi:hypothetical protein
MKKRSLFGCILVASALCVSAQTWTDISSAVIAAKGLVPGYPGGCSGVAVNRLTGDVYIKIIDNGIWKSGDQGSNWTRIDNNTIGGRCESGVGLNADQNNPVRIAVFSLDGDCGYTTDGTTWHTWAGMGRNWDFGSVDWGAVTPLVILAAKHEDGGKVFKSTDGGVTWIQLSITVNAQSANDRSMIGVMDANTFIYCAGNGIQRSTDAGATWASVSTTTVRTKIPVLFNGKHYLGTATGLLVSSDKGATWHTQGGTVQVTQGPFFGADENTMVVVSTAGLYKTTNAGTTWTRLTGLASSGGTTFDPLWYGGFSWDPIHNVAYAAQMVYPAYKFVFPLVAVVNPLRSGAKIANRSDANGTVHIVGDHMIRIQRSAVTYDIKGKKIDEKRSIGR